MIKKDISGQVMSIFGLMMVIMLIIAGIFILISPSLGNWPKNFRTIFAIVIIAYGLFRLVNIIMKFKNREVEP
jgi:hypothetical protein